MSWLTIQAFVKFCVRLDRFGSPKLSLSCLLFGGPMQRRFVVPVGFSSRTTHNTAKSNQNQHTWLFSCWLPFKNHNTQQRQNKKTGCPLNKMSTNHSQSHLMDPRRPVQLIEIDSESLKATNLEQTREKHSSS